jgi:TRAP-type mannitol/chloroaromatic compound transport system permease small subunit
MKRLLYIIATVNEWVGKVVSLWIIALIGIVLFEVVMRYVFNRPTIWVHETSVYIYGAMWILVGGLVLLRNRMVNMEIFYVRLSPRGRAIMDLCTFFFAFAYTAVLLWTSWNSAWDSVLWQEHSETAWRVPYYPFRLMLPIGAFLLLMQLISRFIKDLYFVLGRTINER